MCHKAEGLSTACGAAREIQEGIAVDPFLVGCGVKLHDFRPLAQRLFMALSQNLPMNLILAAS
ncbi:hypothetical protein AYI94_13880 [Shewanella algae]|nr:hypothetical protein AYI94_13880 [Shewanella algae]